MLLFLAAAAAVRAGKLNLNHSNRYRAIQDYLIPIKFWSTDREQMLVQAGLERFADGQACLDGLREELEIGYERVNSHHLSGDNEHLSIGDDGRPRVKTPATDFSEDGTVGRLLVDGGIVPVLQILRDVNQAHEFVPCFKHLSPKHHKLKPAAEIVIAGIMGLGWLSEQMRVQITAHVS